MIYDAFLFFNELDLLKIRLEELKDVVDRFVLVEATLTFSGASKPLYFELHRDIFSEYADRITHHVVTDVPRFARTSRYLRQFHQRDSIGIALERAGCKPDDLVMVSDVDEIPCGETLPEALALLGSNDLVILEQTYHHDYVNNIREHNWLGTYACRYDFLQAFGSVHKLRYGKQTLRRTGVDLRKKAIEQKYPRFPHGGWHLSWFGGPDAVLYKQQSYSQSLKVPAANRRMPYIRFNTGLSKLVDDPGAKAGPGPSSPRSYDVGCGLPRYLSENRELFSHFFEPVDAGEEKDGSTEWHEAKYNLRRHLYARVELLIERCRRMFWDHFPRFTATLKRLIRLR
jgi:beta-1,4-mannosyl-glycoprotein beta-1,4-N-acetylglucosaminyltransferase